MGQAQSKTRVATRNPFTNVVGAANDNNHKQRIDNICEYYTRTDYYNIYRYTALVGDNSVRDRNVRTTRIIVTEIRNAHTARHGRHPRDRRRRRPRVCTVPE